MRAFSGIAGQDKAVSFLSRALEEGQLTHAYLLAGATAATRRALARSFAAAVLAFDGGGAAAGACVGGGNGKGAGAGAGANGGSGAGAGAGMDANEGSGAGENGGVNAVAADGEEAAIDGEEAAAADGEEAAIDNEEAAAEIVANGHPDLRELSPGGAGAYLVDQVREVVADAALAPIRAKRKVYVFDDADCLTGAPANALLKTLEEPPFGVVCILLASCAGALLPTLRSRCVVLTLAAEEEAPAGEDTVLFELLFSIAMRADNRAVLAGAKAIVEVAAPDGGEIEKRHNAEADAYADYLSAGARKAMAERHKREERSAKRGGLDAELALARSWLRDCLLVQQGAEALVRHAWCVQRTAQVAGQASTIGLLAAIEAVNTCEQRIHYNVTPQLACEAMLFEIRRALCR